MSEYMAQKMDEQIEGAQYTFAEMHTRISQLERELSEACELISELKKELEDEANLKALAYSRLHQSPNITMLSGELAFTKEQLAAATKDRDRLQSLFDAATEIQGDDEVIKYVTSGNAIPVTRCTVSADLLRQLIGGRSAATKRADEAIRRLQYMHSAHSDSLQWYQNAIAQALKSLDALPAKLEF